MRAADTGTILLDEISEMPLNLQSKLLRVIQEKQVLPIGSSSEVEVDVRIIATTNRNMFNEVKLGNFREDLFYRLNVFPINNLSLAARVEDIIPIVAHLLFKSQIETAELLSISEEALLSLMQHSWPGNVRELDNIIQRARILSSGDTIQLTDLILIIMQMTNISIRQKYWLLNSKPLLTMRLSNENNSVKYPTN